MIDCDLPLSVIAAAQSALKAMTEKWAYQIWENEGRPSGRDMAHWQRAQEAFAAPANEPQHPAANAYVPNSRFATYVGAMCGGDYHFNARSHAVQLGR